MITTVTLNIALDITYAVDSFTPYTSVRVQDVAERAGGKGINVSRVSNSLDRSTLIMGFVGGTVGSAILADLNASGLNHELVPITGQTRRSVGVVDRSVGDATVFNEAGPIVTQAEFEQLAQLVAGHLSGTSVLVIAGSLPPGLPDSSVAALVELGANAGVPVVVDTSGPALMSCLAARPSLVKPNIHEIRESTGIADPVAAARSLIEAGARTVAVSLGSDGLMIVDGSRGLLVRPPGFVKGNPTGAGDAAVAALAQGLATGAKWSDTAQDAVALSAAAVAAPLAGSFDSDVYKEFLTRTTVEEIT